MRKLLYCAVLSTSFLCFAQSASFRTASEYIEAKRYADAARILSGVEKTKGLSHNDTMSLFRLQGVLAVAQGDTAKAKLAFQKLLAIAPNSQTPKSSDENVARIFFDAQSSAKQVLIEAKAAKAAIVKGKVMQIAAKISGDSLKLAKAVRFHVKADDLPWVEVEQEISQGYAAVDTEGLGVKWYAEVLGERARELVLIGSEDVPQLEGKATQDAPVVKKGPDPVIIRDDPDLPTIPEADPATVAIKYGTKYPAFKPLGWTLLSAGVIAGGVGTYFGVRSSNARSQVSKVQTDAQGRVTSMTQKQAYNLDADARRSALVANVLWGVGGGVAASGILFLILGRNVPITPTTTGIVVSGNF